MPTRPLPPLPAALREAPHSGIREISNQALLTPGAIRLDVGQPDFRTPSHIAEAGKRAIDEGYTFYTHTQGLLSLRERLADKLSRVNRIHTSPDLIACGPGGAGAVAASLAAVVDHGDEVLLPDPGWPNYRLMLTWTGTRGFFYPCPASTGYLPDMDALKAMVGPRTRVLVINSPNNPTGAVYPRSCLESLAAFAQRHDLWILSDECYDQTVFDGSFQSMATVCDDGRVISVFTFSKTYAMTGWRLGYVTAGPEVIDSTTKVLESNSSCVSTISQRAGEAALDGPQDCVGEMVDAYRARRDVAVELLHEAGLLTVVPEGAFYVMADISAAGMGSRDFAFALLRDMGVSTAPGSAFGDVASNAVRISLASSEADIREGIGRIAAYVRTRSGD